MKGPRAKITAPAAIIPWGGPRSTQMAAATTDSAPRPPAAASRPLCTGVRSSRPEEVSGQKMPEAPAFRSRAANTSRKPSLRSRWRLESGIAGIVAVLAKCEQRGHGLGGPRPSGATGTRVPARNRGIPGRKLPCEPEPPGRTESPFSGNLDRSPVRFMTGPPDQAIRWSPDNTPGFQLGSGEGIRRPAGEPCSVRPDDGRGRRREPSVPANPRLRPPPVHALSAGIPGAPAEAGRERRNPDFHHLVHREPARHNGGEHRSGRCGVRHPGTRLGSIRDHLVSLRVGVCRCAPVTKRR